MIINKSLVKVHSDIAAVQADTDDLQVQVGVAGLGLSAIPNMALDSTVAKAAVLGAAVGASISADIAAVKAVADLGAVASTVTSAFGVTDSKVDAVKAVVDLGAVASTVTAAFGVTDGKIDSLDGVVDGLITTVGAAGAGLSAIPDMALASVLGAAVGASISADVAAVKAAVDALGGGASEAKGSFSWLATPGGEQTIYELVTTTRKRVEGMWFDLSAMTLVGTVKAYCKINGTDYVEFSSEPFDPAIDSDGFYLDVNMGITDSIKVTYNCSEVADKAIPYSIIWTILE